MKVKNNRLEALKMLISSQELSSQEQLLQALHKEGFKITQATLSRDLKLLKVAKAASSSGKYAYVLPNDALYKTCHSTLCPVSKMVTEYRISVHQFLRQHGSYQDASGICKQYRLQHRQ